MLNFLQQKNKNKVIFEYLLRVSIYFLSFTLISSIILTALFFPSFFFVRLKSKTIEAQLSSIKQQTANKGDDPVVFIKNVNRLSVALAENTNIKAKNSEIIDTIVSLKNKDIQITSIDIEPNITGQKKVIISGFAKTRDALTAFDKEIRVSGFFSNVVFPVSNFIKSSDSDFIATLTL